MTILGLKRNKGTTIGIKRRVTKKQKSILVKKHLSSMQMALIKLHIKKGGLMTILGSNHSLVFGRMKHVKQKLLNMKGVVNLKQDAQVLIQNLA